MCVPQLLPSQFCGAMGRVFSLQTLQVALLRAKLISTKANGNRNATTFPSFFRFLSPQTFLTYLNHRFLQVGTDSLTKYLVECSPSPGRPSNHLLILIHPYPLAPRGLCGMFKFLGLEFSTRSPKSETEGGERANPKDAEPGIHKTNLMPVKAEKLLTTNTATPGHSFSSVK